MSEGKGIIFRGGESGKNADRKAERKNLSDVDSVFLEALSTFPSEIRDALAEISPQTRKKLFARPEPNQDMSEMRRKGAVGGIRMGTMKDLENLLREARHADNDWAEDEIEKMDSVKREMIVRNMLRSFLDSIEIQKIAQKGPVDNITEIMNSLWSNRSRRNAGDMITEYRAEYFRDVQEEYALLLSEQKKLMDEIARLKSKKSLNRPSTQRLEELERQLAQRFGRSWHGRNTFYATEGLRGRLFECEKELQRMKSERTWERTLAIALQFMDATDFSVVFHETFGRECRWLEYHDPTRLQELFSQIDSWYHTHQQERPLKEAPEKNISSEKKQLKLFEHFWRLFHSVVRLQSDPETPADRIQNTIRELAVVLYMLK